MQMTKELRQDIHDLITVANAQGEDNMGYVHYVERYYFDQVEFLFNKECRKQGDFKHAIQSIQQRETPASSDGEGTPTPQSPLGLVGEMCDDD